MQIKMCSEEIDNDAAYYIIVCNRFWKNYATNVGDVLNLLITRLYWIYTFYIPNLEKLNITLLIQIYGLIFLLSSQLSSILVIIRSMM